MSFVLFCIKTARPCHLSFLPMDQTEDLATKRIFGVITLLITDFLAGITAFSPVTGLSYIIAVHLQELIAFFLQDASLLCAMVCLHESST